MRRFALAETTTLVLSQGDITNLAVDAIVNAANERMLGGGGVDGAIHRAAGRELLAACRAIPELRAGVRCPTGEARITPAFNLPARFVIHTVGPVYKTAAQAAPVLAAAYQSVFALAHEHGLCSVAFPAISCGVYGYPLAEAAHVAIGACCQYGVGTSVREIHFVLFSDQAYAAWEHAARGDCP